MFACESDLFKSTIFGGFIWLCLLRRVKYVCSIDLEGNLKSESSNLVSEMKV